MIPDRELWACARQVINHHGSDVDRYIASRVKALTEAGDAAGVAAWRAIADRVDRLCRAPDAQEALH